MKSGNKTYIFKIVIEDDPRDDGQQAYHASCPVLEQYGASTWGDTKEEALQHIQEVVQMIVEELLEKGASLPPFPSQDVEVCSEPRIAITVFGQRNLEELRREIAVGLEQLDRGEVAVYDSSAALMEHIKTEGRKRHTRGEINANLLEALESPASAMTNNDWEAIRREGKKQAAARKKKIPSK